MSDLHEQTQILDGFDVGELVLTVQTNCPKINAESVINTFHEILNLQAADAEAFVYDNLEEIITQAMEGRDNEHSD